MNLAIRVGSVAVSPSPFGLTATGVASAVLVARSSITDPSLAALAWTAFVALLVLGVVVPVVAISRLRLGVVGQPADTVVGRPTALRLAVSGPAILDSVAIGGRGDRWSCPVGEESVIELTWDRRSVRSNQALYVTTDGPLGVVRIAKHVRVDLPRPLAIGPDPLAQSWTVPVAPDDGSEAWTGSALGSSDRVRSVRPYRSGDPAHLVHWPTSARVGSLVVKEFEPPVRPGIVLVVDLGASDEAIEDRRAEAERVVADAAGLALAVLRGGGGVMLCTCEEGRPIAAEVGDAQRLNRRLAAVGAGVPGAVGSGGGGAAWPVVVKSL